MRDQILSYALKYQGEWNQITDALARQEPWEKVTCTRNFITIADSQYPDSLRRLRYAPWILFYEGDIGLLNQRAVAIVGARKCNDYGAAMGRHVCDVLKARAVIVSGLAKGIDAIVHQAALSEHSIGVIGCGCNVMYPKENVVLYKAMRKNQLIISEYPDDVKPLAHHFPWRNRLIAALSSAVIVIQAKPRSGTMLTVNEALEINVPIYCIPHMFQDAYGSGCNLLISQGANILVDDQDILAIL